ncbi:hypothetical protein D3C71_1548920 [compost metagenome]
MEELSLRGYATIRVADCLDQRIPGAAEGAGQPTLGGSAAAGAVERSWQDLGDAAQTAWQAAARTPSRAVAAPHHDRGLAGSGVLVGDSGR